jgi:hypothetical protein
MDNHLFLTSRIRRSLRGRLIVVLRCCAGFKKWSIVDFGTCKIWWISIEDCPASVRLINTPLTASESSWPSMMMLISILLKELQRGVSLNIEATFTTSSVSADTRDLVIRLPRNNKPIKSHGRPSPAACPTVSVSSVGTILRIRNTLLMAEWTTINHMCKQDRK